MRVIATAIIVIRIMIITILVVVVVVIITKVILRSICRRGLRTGDAVGVPETWRTRQPSISRPLAVMSFLTTTSNLDAIHNTVRVVVVFSLRCCCYSSFELRLHPNTAFAKKSPFSARLLLHDCTFSCHSRLNNPQPKYRVYFLLVSWQLAEV